MTLPGNGSKGKFRAQRQEPGGFRTRGFRLADWHAQGVEKWWQGDNAGPHRGTLEIFTGGGKTLVALACIERAASYFSDLKVAVVVPSEALARQWESVLLTRTHLTPDDVGLLGTGGKDNFDGHRVLVTVLNTAAKRLPEMAETVRPLMLIVDECHRAGAPTFSRVLKTPAVATLGLSATPEREEVDEEGEPLLFDEQLVGQALGPVVQRFGLKEARNIGWLPDYKIFHHGLKLTDEESLQYDTLSRKVDDAAERMREMGIETSRARVVATRDDVAGKLAQAWVSATSLRKDLLYRALERERITSHLVSDLLSRAESPRVLLFHERVDEAVQLFERLSKDHPNVTIALEHSRLPPKERTRAIDLFRTGKASLLVSVKSLVEGLDVPEADIGISVASSSSVRQRIQSLGRVLRRRFDQQAPRKHAEMHILYVSGTVDEAIYAKEDWSDLTGAGANTYLLWTYGSKIPELQDSAPREPLPTEDQEWERLGRKVPDPPEPWLGIVPPLEYSVDTRGNVTNALGSLIQNPQGVEQMVEAVRGRSGDRFRVTPEHRLVVVFGEGADDPAPFIAGKLEDPFVAVSLDEQSAQDVPHVASLEPGASYPGPTTKENGTFRIRQKRGGVIERRVGRNTVEFALGDGADGPLRQNAETILEAWRKVSSRGFEFHVNALWHAWFLQEGRARFLAEVRGGFLWPSEVRKSDAVSR